MKVSALKGGDCQLTEDLQRLGQHRFQFFAVFGNAVHTIKETSRLFFALFFHNKITYSCVNQYTSNYTAKYCVVRVTPKGAGITLPNRSFAVVRADAHQSVVVSFRKFLHRL